VQFLSPEWIEAADQAAGDAAVEPSVPLSIETVVEDTPMGDVVYHLAVDSGRIRVASGPAPDPTVRFTQSYDTAKAIASGESSAQVAFMRGDLKVAGNVTALIDGVPVFEELDRVLGPVHERTRY
jgi:SCP-2 sterol transfer family